MWHAIVVSVTKIRGPHEFMICGASYVYVDVIVSFMLGHALWHVV